MKCVHELSYVHRYPAPRDAAMLLYSPWRELSFLLTAMTTPSRGCGLSCRNNLKKQWQLSRGGISWTNSSRLHMPWYKTTSFKDDENILKNFSFTFNKRKLVRKPNIVMVNIIDLYIFMQLQIMFLLRRLHYHYLLHRVVHIDGCFD